MTDAGGSDLTDEQRADVDAALLAYWTSRDEARVDQARRGVVDQGNRAGVTSGGHLDRVAQLFGRICIASGAPASHVYYNAPRDDPKKAPGATVGYTLPGFFRPTKKWDLVVYHNHIPIVIIELKSQNGPSYGNNANNRAEEAVGNATDLARAIEAGLIPGTPWTGYAFVIEDDKKSRKSRGQRDRGYFPKDIVFADWSYLSRVGHLCQRLVEERCYHAVWAVATRRPPDFSWEEPDPSISGYAHFVKGLQDQIVRFYPDRPPPENIPVAQSRPRRRTPPPDGDTVPVI